MFTAVTTAGKKITDAQAVMRGVLNTANPFLETGPITGHDRELT